MIVTQHFSISGYPSADLDAIPDISNLVKLSVRDSAIATKTIPNMRGYIYDHLYSQSTRLYKSDCGKVLIPMDLMYEHISRWSKNLNQLKSNGGYFTFKNDDVKQFCAKMIDLVGGFVGLLLEESASILLDIGRNPTDAAQAEASLKFLRYFMFQHIKWTTETYKSTCKNPKVFHRMIKAFFSDIAQGVLSLPQDPDVVERFYCNLKPLYSRFSGNVPDVVAAAAAPAPDPKPNVPVAASDPKPIAPVAAPEPKPIVLVAASDPKPIVPVAVTVPESLIPVSNAFRGVSCLHEKPPGHPDNSSCGIHHPTVQLPKN